jgi:hypothetical protein
MPGYNYPKSRVQETEGTGNGLWVLGKGDIIGWLVHEPTCPHHPIPITYSLSDSP